MRLSNVDNAASTKALAAIAGGFANNSDNFSFKGMKLLQPEKTPGFSS